MNAINPFIAEAYLTRVLKADAGVIAYCGERVAPAEDGFEPRDFLADDDESTPESDLWPFILFGGPGRLETFAEDLVLQEDEMLIRVFTREDFAPPGVHFVTYALGGYMAIQSALQGVNGASVDLGNGETGTVHGCQILPAKHKTIQGERGRRVCEMGLTVRLTTN